VLVFTLPTEIVVLLPLAKRLLFSVGACMLVVLSAAMVFPTDVSNSVSVLLTGKFVLASLVGVVVIALPVGSCITAVLSSTPMAGVLFFSACPRAS